MKSMKTLRHPRFAAWLAASATLGAALLSAPALAQYSGPGATPAATSVQAILAKPVDDQPVNLRGKIVRQIKGDKYIFSDGKGEIRVDIDDKLLQGISLNEQTLVEISGEVEKDFMESPEIDVDVLRVVR